MTTEQALIALIAGLPTLLATVALALATPRQSQFKRLQAEVADLREANDQHLKDKKEQRTELAEVRAELAEVRNLLEREQAARRLAEQQRDQAEAERDEYKELARTHGEQLQAANEKIELLETRVGKVEDTMQHEATNE